MEDKETFPSSSTDQSSFHTKWATYSSYRWALDSQTIERTNNQRKRTSEEAFWKLCKTHWKGQLPSNYFSSKPRLHYPSSSSKIYGTSQTFGYTYSLLLCFQASSILIIIINCDYYAQINTNNLILINNPWAQFTFVYKNNLKHLSCNNFRSNIKVLSVSMGSQTVFKWVRNSCYCITTCSL